MSFYRRNYRNLKTKSLCFCLSGFMLINVERGKQSVVPGGSTTYCMWRCLDYSGLSSGLDVRLRLQRKGGQFLIENSAASESSLEESTEVYENCLSSM